jgi:hypothetical protein
MIEIILDVVKGSRLVPNTSRAPLIARPASHRTHRISPRRAQASASARRRGIIINGSASGVRGASKATSNCGAGIVDIVAENPGGSHALVMGEFGQQP